MAKKALCVGINDYPLADMDLKGCVNDAKSWASLLRRHYDFASRDVTVVLDADATHARVVRELKDLLAGARSGDVLVFTNSSHGTYLADLDAGEEADRYDEAMCPYDCKQHLLLDDELRELFDDIPRGVRMTVVSDSCHSGSVTRAAPFGLTPDERRVRFMHPGKLRNPVIDDVQLHATPRETRPESDMRELLVSGCRANQYSYDAKIGSSFHGAMTWHAMQVIKAADYRLTYAALVQRLRASLAASIYDQEPQLEGRSSFKRRQIFT